MDIVILIFLSFKISKLAKIKGLKPSVWIVRLVALFIATELAVAYSIISIMGMEKILYVIIPALSFALVSSYFVFKQLNDTDGLVGFDLEDNLIEEEKPDLDHFR